MEFDSFEFIRQIHDLTGTILPLEMIVDIMMLDMQIAEQQALLEAAQAPEYVFELAPPL